jgi:hypothetical protein
MAIRKLNLLATSEIAEAPFRSLQEIDDYLDEQVKKKLDELDALIRQYQLQFSRNEVKSALEFKIGRGANRTDQTTKEFKVERLTKVVIPKLDTLRQNFKVVDELSDQVDAMETLYNKTMLDCGGMRGLADVLKKIKAMQKSAEVKMDKALVFLRTVGEKYSPTPFKELVQATMTTVAAGLNFKSFDQFIYGYETKDQNMAFTYYVQLKGLTDEQGEIYPSFFLVFTCVLKQSEERAKVTPNYYVTVMHEFATPGKYMLGKQVGSASQAATALGVLLDLENISSAIGTLPHNLDPKKVSKNKFSPASKIEKLEVSPDAFTFTMVPAVKQDEFNKIMVILYKEMKSMWSHIKKARIRVKPSMEGVKHVVRFTLTTPAGTGKVSVQDVDFLKEHFDMSDDKIRKVVQILNND